MFGLGSTEILIILVILLFIIGAGKLPDAARTVGKAFKEYKKAEGAVRKATDIRTYISQEEDKDNLYQKPQEPGKPRSHPAA